MSLPERIDSGYETDIPEPDYLTEAQERSLADWREKTTAQGDEEKWFAHFGDGAVIDSEGRAWVADDILEANRWRVACCEPDGTLTEVGVRAVDKFKVLDRCDISLFLDWGEKRMMGKRTAPTGQSGMTMVIRPSNDEKTPSDAWILCFSEDDGAGEGDSGDVAVAPPPEDLQKRSAKIGGRTIDISRVTAA